MILITFYSSGACILKVRSSAWNTSFDYACRLSIELLSFCLPILRKHIEQLQLSVPHLNTQISRSNQANPLRLVKTSLSHQSAKAHLSRTSQAPPAFFSKLESNSLAPSSTVQYCQFKVSRIKNTNIFCRTPASTTLGTIGQLQHLLNARINVSRKYQEDVALNSLVQTRIHQTSTYQAISTLCNTLKSTPLPQNLQVSRYFYIPDKALQHNSTISTSCLFLLLSYQPRPISVTFIEHLQAALSPANPEPQINTFNTYC